MAFECKHGKKQVPARIEEEPWVNILFVISKTLRLQELKIVRPRLVDGRLCEKSYVYIFVLTIW